MTLAAFFTPNMDVHVMQDGEMPPMAGRLPLCGGLGGRGVVRRVGRPSESVEVELPMFGPEGSLLETVFMWQFPGVHLAVRAEEYRVVPTELTTRGTSRLWRLCRACRRPCTTPTFSGQGGRRGSCCRASAQTPSNTTYINAWQPGARALPRVGHLRVVGGRRRRTISVGWLLGNGARRALVIPPDEITTFHQEAVVQWVLTHLSPHALLGKSYKVWMETFGRG